MLRICHRWVSNLPKWEIFMDQRMWSSLTRWFIPKWHHSYLRLWVIYDYYFCIACYESWGSWSGTTAYEWTTCKIDSTATYYRYQDECLLNCPSGYYADEASQEWQVWHSFCTECFGSLASECTEWDTASRYVYAEPDTWQYLVCPDGTYHDAMTNSWIDWNESCLTCSGGNNDDCLSCPSSTVLSDQNICQTCSEINSGLKYSTLIGECTEICGKGFNLGSLDCDDGNSINGDGCNEFCKVETDFLCENGTESSPDQCKSLIAPTWEFTSISSVTLWTSIHWSETVRLNEIEDGDITIEVTGPLSPYSFTYTIDETTGYEVGTTSDSFFIQFEFKTSLAGSDQELITLTINNNTFIEDQDRNYLAKKSTEISIPFSYFALSEEEKQAASQQSSASILSLVLTFGTSLLIQFVMGGTIEASWLLLGTLQLMSFLPLLNLNLPSNFREFSKNLSVLHGEPEAFPNIFKYYYDTLEIVMEPFNEYFELMSFKTSYLLLNSGRKVMIWIGIGISMIVSWILVDLFLNIGRWGKIINKVDVKLRYGFIIRAVSQSYLSLVLSTALNVYMISWSGNVSIISNLIAWSAAIMMLYIPIISFSTIFKTSDLKNEQFQKRFKTFIIDLRTDNPFRFHFTTIFYFRRAIYACVFVVWAAFPTLQVITQSITVVFMTCYLLIKPYKSALSSILSILNELMLLFMIGICWRFTNPIIQPDQSKILGNFLTLTIVFTIIINWCGIITFGVISMVKSRLVKNKQKKLRDLIKARNSSVS